MQVYVLSVVKYIFVFVRVCDGSSFPIYLGPFVSRLRPSFEWSEVEWSLTTQTRRMASSPEPLAPYMYNRRQLTRLAI